MSRIAAEAGVSKGTLYNYFCGKAELFAAYMRRECTRWIVLAFDELDDATPPADVLHHIGRRMTAMVLSDASLVIYRMVVAEAEKFPELDRRAGSATCRPICAAARKRGSCACRISSSPPNNFSH